MLALNVNKRTIQELEVTHQQSRTMNQHLLSFFQTIQQPITTNNPRSWKTKGEKKKKTRALQEREIWKKIKPT